MIGNAHLGSAPTTQFAGDASFRHGAAQEKVVLATNPDPARHGAECILLKTRNSTACVRLSTAAMDRMHVLVERKLKSEISRKDRDLRRMLGHFDMLERVNSQKYADEVVRMTNNTTSDKTPRFAETTNTHVEDVAIGESDDGSRCSEWSDLDKAMVVINGIEVDDDDDDCAISDDGSIPDEDELPEYDDVPGAQSILIEDEVYHSPPSYVEDALNELNKMSLEPSFEESTYEVSEDD